MMPAQVLARAVPVLAYPIAKPAHFADQLFARHRFEIVVHGVGLSRWRLIGI
jgi:hypothetical protein